LSGSVTNSLTFRLGRITPRWEEGRYKTIDQTV
jgi:hypothetical protein